MADLVGQTLGQYRIEAPLGSGGMGQVFRGVHVMLERPAAIKVMQAHLAVNPEFRSRFLDEAKSAAALRHPNIVEIYEFGEQDGLLYLVMELMNNGSLRTILRRNAGQPLSLSLGLDLVRQAALGLAAAHTRNVVHRDIKPDNLLLTNISGIQPGEMLNVLKISDFGLARMAESGGLSTTGAPMGTLAYMSPEQCQGIKLDGRSDLYSLGIVLYEVVTGYQPFQINNFNEALYKHINVAPPSPRNERPDLPSIIEEIILRCLAKKPEERFATTTELAAALQKAMGNVGSMPLTMPYPSPEQLTPAGGTVLQPPGSGGTLPPVVSILTTFSVVPRIRVLDKSGQTLQLVEIKSQGLVVGRQSGNDIVLSAQGISRQHVQVLWDGMQVTVKDLGSSNGTLLGDKRLLPQMSQTWMERQLLRIGPFWLRLEGTSPGTGNTQTALRSVSPNVTNVLQTQSFPSMVSSGRFGIHVSPKTLTINPGQSATIQVMLTNLGSTVDWFTPTVEGVPPEWMQGVGQEVQLNPGMQETFELGVNVTRTPNNLAQDYPVTIRVHSREKPEEAGTIQVRWTVLPFKGDVLRIEPRLASGRGSASYTVSLNNGGNTPGHYELSGEDDEQKMDYRFNNNLLDLAPGREVRVPLTVKTRRHWIGKEQRQPFQIHALATSSNSPLTAVGEFVNKVLIPTWVFPVALVVVAAGVSLASFLGVLPSVFGHASPTPTSTTFTIVDQTPPATTVVTPTSAPGVTPTATPSSTPVPTATPSPTPMPTITPTPTPQPLPASSVTTIASNLGGAIGSQYVASQDRLYFTEYSGNLSVLNNVRSGTPSYQVLGTGYTNPEAVYVTADGSTAYVTERSGDLVRISLSNPNRDQAIVIASGLTIPHQIVLDEARGYVYMVEFANPGRLLRVDLNNGNQMTPIVSNLHNAIGLLMSPDFNVAYISEQLDNGTGQLVRFDLNTGNNVVLVTSTTAPLFELTWANANDTAILVTERDPANKVWFVDLTAPSLQFVASVASRPSSVVRVSQTGLFPLLVCTNSEIDKLS